MDGLAPALPGPVTGPQFDNRRVLAALIDLLLLVPVAVLMSPLFGGFASAAAALTLGRGLYHYFALESTPARRPRGRPDPSPPDRRHRLLPGRACSE
jgi:hypothetical protein